MSHYQQIKCRIREAPLLLESLREIGYAAVEYHEQADHLYGYQGDRRPETAEVIIRREYVGRMSNDIGFKRQEDGEFNAIISEYDRTRYNAAWLQELNQRYAYKVVMAYAHDADLIVENEQTRENGEIVILLSERG
jgi:hypothetical protein